MHYPLDKLPAKLTHAKGCHKDNHDDSSRATTISHSTAAHAPPNIRSSWRDDYKEPESIVPIGGTLHYKCRPQPVATGTFFKDDRNVSSEWAKLEIRNATVSDGGVYQCVSAWWFEVEKFFTHYDSIGYAIVPCKSTISYKLSHLLVFLA